MITKIEIGKTYISNHRIVTDKGYIKSDEIFTVVGLEKVSYFGITEYKQPDTLRVKILHDNKVKIYLCINLVFAEYFEAASFPFTEIS